MQALRVNSTLQGGKYRIIKKLGQGGFGITYLAENTLLEGKVAIKEFFFKEYCERDDSTSRVTIPTSGNREIVERFKQKFIKEARTIFKLNHPNIVRIFDVFEENGTAYYVMEYIEGESLGDMVKRRGAIPEAEALGYVKDAASALVYIHGKNINHLDIKPSNLVLRKEDGKVLVIDFGVAKQYDAVTSEGTTTTPVGISHGYSPAEQYRKNGVQAFSPQSDVYALAATLFKLLTGNTPPEAMEIQDEGLPVDELLEQHISRPVISAIAMAMKGRHERTQSVAEFISNLSSDDTVVIPNSAEVERKRKEAEEKAAKEKAEAERKRKEAEEKAAKEKAEAERNRKETEEKAAKEKAEAERKREEAEEKAAKEKAEAERKREETEEKAAKEKAEAECKRKDSEEMGEVESRPTKSLFKSIWLWSTVAAVVIVAVWQMIPSNSPTIGNANYTPNVKTFYANGVSFEMVEVRGGTFRMGATSEQGSDADSDDEYPVHSVTLSGYYIGKTEVTQALWKAVMGSNPSRFKGDNMPVECVSWNDCQEFIRKLNSLPVQTFRLPTEAEWEFPCRGGNNSRGYKYSGSNNLGSVAWCVDNNGGTTHTVDIKAPNELGIYDMNGNSGGKTHPVGTKVPNELGIYDMSGNVWEWCNDWYGDYTTNPQKNPTGPLSGSDRVNRGGSWFDIACHCCSSFRRCDIPAKCIPLLGLRLAL